MRVMLKAQWDMQAGNDAIASGKIGDTIEAILNDLKPEAAYFIAEDGTRTSLLFLDIENPSQLPAIAEPWFLAFNAKVDVTPCMKIEELKEAGPAIARVVKQFA